MSILALIVLHTLAWGSAALGAPVGPEFRINTTTTGIQRTTFDSMPAVAVDDAGNFVVVWTSEGQDSGVSKGVYGQRYNASGVPQGGEFLINTTVAGDQLDPSVAMDASGDFVVSWTGLDVSGMGVFFQRFNAAGVAQGTETQANTYTTNDQKWSSTAMDAVGNFVVVWASEEQDGSRTGVYGQRFDASGVPQDGEMHISTRTQFEQDSPVVSMNASGAFVVCWSGWAQDSGNTWGSFAQLYNADGTPNGNEFQTNTTTASDQWYNRCAMDDSGNFTVVWESQRQDSATDGGIFAQRYNASGTPVGSEFGVNTHTVGEQWESAVAYGSDGDFVIVWGSDGQDGSGVGIYGQRYLANGTPNGGEFHISTTTSGMQERPAVAMVTDEEFVVVWSGNGTGDDAGIFGQRFGSAPGANVVTNTSDSGPGSLRAAIDYANLNPGTTVTFDIPDTDPGYQTSGADHWWRIAPTGALPTITGTGTTIDGASQATNRGDVNSQGPEIEINGAAAGIAHGFLVTSANNLVHGLIINGFAESDMAGIRINGSGATLNTVSGCYIGTNFSGMNAVPNTMGIAIYDRTTANTIGGVTAAERNVLSGNTSYGIMLSGILGNPTTDNVIVGNYIGTTAAGDAALANSTGINMNPGVGRTTIGGTDVTARNVISGNGSRGISIGGSATVDNEVIGNFVGTDATGTTAIGNNQAIMFMTGSTGNTIGGTTAAHRNIIAGGNYGITFYSDSNEVIGNYIGTDVTGTVPLGQGNYAVYFALSGQSNVVGGTGPGAANLIAYSGSHGIYHDGTGAGNQFSGNSIHSSGGRGILLNAGANNDKLPPVLSSVTPSGSDFTVTATVDPGDVIEFFRVNNPSSPVVTPDASGSGEGYLYLGSCSDAGVASGPHISSVVDADPTAGVLEVTLLDSGLSNGDYVTITATNATDGTSEFAINVQAGSAYSIAGRVFEDADFAGTATNWDGGAGDLALVNADVELYDDGDAYLASATTAADGTFTFSGLNDGTFKVRLRSATIGDADTPPSNGLHPTVPVTWPYPLAEMTWGHGSALIGGQDLTVDDTSTGDNAGPGDTWVAVTISGGDVGAVNFGFSYDLVVNGDDDLNVDDVRSKQGCLRQFIKNSNAIIGVNKSWFQIAVP